ncbi:hypothetical protein MVLG_01347 [Microbotryum lychnidis-dioicae p1A1 Lamole]|uniref:UBX domain-containing protein n=1 Tax=Microbotryum lychnidis-dioicae (strain p1A1 Lamole / MvSl-1064) TaxID=683840 RepID=U5H1V0_USTV1|nr:hypothetical protein MVLG_01347 [Microbotryum lychnidis-dioicae p1A1 Lamole]|eukprot:KDE08574.1 hypothetical protein MVLG_01347 [Microbotryum lychnidis-dioicae p1A1 Lamole]
MSDANDPRLDQFVSITGADPSRARFFLDSANGDLQVAMAHYFEHAGDDSGGNDIAVDDDDDGLDDQDAQLLQPATRTAGSTPAATSSSFGQNPSSSSSSSGLARGAYTLSGKPAPPLPAGWGAASGSSPSTRSSTPSNPIRSSGGPRVTGFRDLASAGRPSNSISSHGGNGPRIGRIGQTNDDDDHGRSGGNDPQEFFAGGGKSGLSVENPNANRGKFEDTIKGIFEKAIEGARRAAGGGESSEGASPANPRGVFAGAAHTLGSDEVASSFIPDPACAKKDDDDDNDSEGEQETAIRNLTFWKDGFSIEDGDLMRYDDPANAEVLKAINAGRAPLSLLNVRHDQPVELRVARRMSEDWVRQPPPPEVPFAGSGHRLGSEAPTFAAAPSTTSHQAALTASAAISTSSTFQVDPSQPTTTLQIRLRSGERMVARFNHTHTVGDIRAYINASQPGQATANYALQTPFPSRDLTDDSKTIKDAGLLGSVVVQRGL